MIFVYFICKLHNSVYFKMKFIIFVTFVSEISRNPRWMLKDKYGSYIALQDTLGEANVKSGDTLCIAPGNSFYG